MINLEMLAGSFRLAALQDVSESALYSLLARRVAEDEAVLKVAAAANPGQSPPFLLFAAVHALLLENGEGELARFFPTITGLPLPKADPYPAFRDFVLNNSERIVAAIRKAHVNKTVLMRSACLRAMVVKVAVAKGWDRVHLVDVGCGAGFNLLMDHWRITYQGAGDVGPADSPVSFSIDLRGDSLPPLEGLPEFLSKTGIDLDRFDPMDEGQKRWLLGGLYPDHLEIYSTTRRALRLLPGHQPRIVVGDAADLLAAVLSELPHGDPVLVMHSLTLHQMSLGQRQGVFMAIRQASSARPIVRVGMELSGNKALLSIAESPDGEALVVGESDHDAAWLQWH